MKTVTPQRICLAVLMLSLLQGCSHRATNDPRASFDPDAFENSEEARAKKLAPMMDSFAQHMWLSTVKDGANTEE